MYFFQAVSSSFHGKGGKGKEHRREVEDGGRKSGGDGEGEGERERERAKDFTVIPEFS